MSKPVVANEEIMEHKEVFERSRWKILVMFAQKVFAETIVDLLDNPVGATEVGRLS